MTAQLSSRQKNTDKCQCFALRSSVVILPKTVIVDQANKEANQYLLLHITLCLLSIIAFIHEHS